MTKFNTIAASIVAAVFVISGVYAVNTVVQHTSVELPRILMIGSADDEQWRRTLVGARAAAKDFGVELQAEAPALDQTAEKQSELVRRIRPAEIDGVAISMQDPVTQVELINDLARQTKLVTLGKDAQDSKRLCHVGFSQVGAGAKAALLARCEANRSGQIVLLTTDASDEQEEIVRQRLAGFQESWPADRSKDNSIVIVPIGIGGNLPEALRNPKVALIVALDAEAAESAIKTMASRPESDWIPIIALDTSEIVLSAIEDGRVSSAVFNDAYDDGYEAIRLLAKYSREDEAGLPTPGCGTIPRNGEIVRKSNVPDVRARLAITETAGGGPQLHLSSADANVSLLSR